MVMDQQRLPDRVRNAISTFEGVSGLRHVAVTQKEHKVEKTSMSDTSLSQVAPEIEVAPEIDAAVLKTVDMMNQETEKNKPVQTVTRVKLPQCYGDKFAVIIDHVLTKEECDALIEMTENTDGLGYGTALLNVGGGRQIEDTSVRKGDRCIVDSYPLAHVIFERIRAHVPTTWKQKYSQSPWHLVGLNERLRFLKYGETDYFRPHFDGCYIRPGGQQRSFITLQLYLNDGFEGGQTTIFDTQESGEEVAVEPHPGRVLLFQHNILHEGTVLRSGHKYAVRTDIMYSTSSLERADENESRIRGMEDCNIQDDDDLL